MKTHRLFEALAVAGLVLALAACSGDAAPPGATPTTEASQSSDDSASAGPTPSVTPASGQMLTIRDIATFHLTGGYEWVVSGDKTSTIATETFEIPKGGESFVQLTASQFPQIADDLERMAEQALIDQQERLTVTLERGENRTLGGVTGYVLAGEGERGQLYEWGGLDENNVLTVFTFVIPEGLDPQEWVEPILASIIWL